MAAVSKLVFDVATESHSDSELLCTPCESSRRSEPAVHFCMDCDELLCQTCTDCHMKFKLTKSHRLRRCEKSEDISGARMLATALMCPRHSDKVIEVRCEEHDDLCCLTCATLVHRDCKSLKEVKNLAPGSKKDKLVKQLRKRIENTKGCIKNILQQNDNVAEEFESSASKVSDTLKEIEASLIRLYKSIEEYIQTKIDKCKNEFKQDTCARREAWKSRLQNTEDMLKLLETALEIGTDSQLYVTIKTISARLEEIKQCTESVDESNILKQKSLNLEMKRGFQTLIKTENVRTCVRLNLIEGDGQVPGIANYLIDDDYVCEANMSSDFLQGEQDSDRNQSRPEAIGGRFGKLLTLTEEVTEAAEITLGSTESDSDDVFSKKQKSKYRLKKERKLKKKEMRSKWKYRSDNEPNDE